MKKSIFRILAIFFIASITFTACQKSENEEFTTNNTKSGISPVAKPQQIPLEKLYPDLPQVPGGYRYIKLLYSKKLKSFNQDGSTTEYTVHRIYTTGKGEQLWMTQDLASDAVQPGYYYNNGWYYQNLDTCYGLNTVHDVFPDINPVTEEPGLNDHAFVEGFHIPTSADMAKLVKITGNSNQIKPALSFNLTGILQLNANFEPVLEHNGQWGEFWNSDLGFTPGYLRSNMIVSPYAFSLADIAPAYYLRVRYVKNIN